MRGAAFARAFGPARPLPRPQRCPPAPRGGPLRPAVRGGPWGFGAASLPPLGCRAAASPAFFAVFLCRASFIRFHFWNSIQESIQKSNFVDTPDAIRHVKNRKNFLQRKKFFLALRAFLTWLPCAVHSACRRASQKGLTRRHSEHTTQGRTGLNGQLKRKKRKGGRTGPAPS